jgi:hypothetical protein
MYQLIGRIVVGFLWRAYGRRIKRAAGAGLAVAALGVAAYLASRSEPEEL